MSSCPKCGVSIDADFGVLNCPSCSTMLNVNIDGSVSLAEEMENAERASQETDMETFSAAEQDGQDAESLENNDTDSWPNPISKAESSEESSQEFSVPDQSFANEDFSQDIASSKEDSPSEEISQVSTSIAEENENNMFEAEEKERTRVLESEGFSDVEEFANSELSSSPNGGILYDLAIDGIDTAKMREEIRLELSDKRYRLNAEALLKSIQDGKMIIRGLNAVKVALLVNRIKRLDVDIQWKQNEVIRM